MSDQLRLAELRVRWEAAKHQPATIDALTTARTEIEEILAFAADCSGEPLPGLVALAGEASMYRAELSSIPVDGRMTVRDAFTYTRQHPDP